MRGAPMYGQHGRIQRLHIGVQLGGELQWVCNNVADRLHLVQQLLPSNDALCRERRLLLAGMHGRGHCDDKSDVRALRLITSRGHIRSELHLGVTSVASATDVPDCDRTCLGPTHAGYHDGGRAP
jgi:hypothetical protein